MANVIIHPGITHPSYTIGYSRMPHMHQLFCKYAVGASHCMQKQPSRAIHKTKTPVLLSYYNKSEWKLAE
jgi:hypothetical protein